MTFIGNYVERLLDPRSIERQPPVPNIPDGSRATHLKERLCQKGKSIPSAQRLQDAR